MRTEDEIDQMLNAALYAFDADASKHNAAVVATLEWVLGENDTPPVDEENER